MGKNNFTKLRKVNDLSNYTHYILSFKQELFLEEITIGRVDNNIIKIDDKRLSSNHCKLNYDKSTG